MSSINRSSFFRNENRYDDDFDLSQIQRQGQEQFSEEKKFAETTSNVDRFVSSRFNHRDIVEEGSETSYDTETTEIERVVERFILGDLILSPPETMDELIQKLSEFYGDYEEDMQEGVLDPLYDALIEKMKEIKKREGGTVAVVTVKAADELWHEILQIPSIPQAPRFTKSVSFNHAMGKQFVERKIPEYKLKNQRAIEEMGANEIDLEFDRDRIEFEKEMFGNQVDEMTDDACEAAEVVFDLVNQVASAEEAAHKSNIDRIEETRRSRMHFRMPSQSTPEGRPYSPPLFHRSANFS